MVIVRFCKPFSPYNEGERACFSLHEASALMARGAAVIIKDATTEPEPPAPVETETHEPEPPAPVDLPKRRK